MHKKFCAVTAFEIIKEYAQRNDLKLHVSDCSMCKYPVGFIWLEGKLHYDSGCDCLRSPILEPKEELDLLNFIRDNPTRVERIMPLLRSITH